MNVSLLFAICVSSVTAKKESSRLASKMHCIMMCYAHKSASLNKLLRDWANRL